MKVTLQAESQECGLACLVMIAGYHSLHLDLMSLRQRFSISIKGTSLVQLVRHVSTVPKFDRFSVTWIVRFSSVFSVRFLSIGVVRCLLRWGVFFLVDGFLVILPPTFVGCDQWKILDTMAYRLQCREAIWMYKSAKLYFDYFSDEGGLI